MIGTWTKSCIIIRQYIRRLPTFSSRYYTTEKVTQVVPQKVAKNEASAVKDIILYKFESPRFFKYLNLFAIAQYGFWTFIGISSLSMVNIPVPQMSEKEEEDTPFWRKINLGSDKYKYGLAVGSLLMGFGILFLSWMYILKTVRYLVLRKDGKTVAFVTYTPFGKNRIMDVPVSNISARGSRTAGTSQMSVEVKGKRMYFIVDIKEGKFIHPQLFDRTVGTKRRFD